VPATTETEPASNTASAAPAQRPIVIPGAWPFPMGNRS
jgi:hypothetical protein